MLGEPWQGDRGLLDDVAGWVRSPIEVLGSDLLAELACRCAVAIVTVSLWPAPRGRGEDRLPSFLRVLVPEVDPVAWAVVDPQLRHALAHCGHVAGVAEGQAPDPDQDARTSVAIPKSLEPPSIQGCLADLDHTAIVSCGIQMAKSGAHRR